MKIELYIPSMQAKCSCLDLDQMARRHCRAATLCLTSNTARELPTSAVKCKEPGTRACIAYLVGRMVSGTACSGVHDHDRGLDARIGGTVRGSRVGLYDYDRKCNFFGTLPDLQDDAAGTRILLLIEEDRFSGRDCNSGLSFSGVVDGREIYFNADSVPPWTGRYTLQIVGDSLSDA